MDFSQKYDLSDEMPGEDARSFRGQQATTGRSVSVHLLPGGRCPANEVVLARIRALPPESLVQLIEVGEHEGAIFVVTDAPPYAPLMEWIQEQERAASEKQRLSRVGTWKIPVLPREPAAAPAPPSPAPRAAAGEATRELEIPAGLRKPGGMPSSSASTAEPTRQMPAAGMAPTGADATRQMPIAAMPSSPAEATRQMPAVVAKPLAEAEATRQMPIPAMPSEATEATRQITLKTNPVPTQPKPAEPTRVYQSPAPRPSLPDSALRPEAKPELPEPEKPWLRRAWLKLVGKDEPSTNS